MCANVHQANAQFPLVGESVDSAEAIDSSTASVTSRPARFAQVTVLCSALPEQVAMCKSTLSTVPTMPTGSKMPSWPSRMNCLGSRCKNSRSRAFDGPRQLHCIAHILAGNLAQARAQINAVGMAGVESPDVRTADPYHAVVNIHMRYAFGPLACRFYRFGRRG